MQFDMKHSGQWRMNMEKRPDWWRLGIDMNDKEPIIVLMLIFAGILAYGILTLKGDDNATDKVTNSALFISPQGADKATDQVEDGMLRQKFDDRMKDTAGSLQSGGTP